MLQLADQSRGQDLLKICSIALTTIIGPRGGTTPEVCHDSRIALDEGTRPQTPVHGTNVSIP